MFETPYDPTETEASHDWITQSTSSAFADEDARRGTHYSVYISKLEAISLAAAAISNGDPYHDEVTDDFCDQEYLYGDARKEVMVRVFEEFSLLREFFTQP